MSENKDINLVARKALELIKENSNNNEEYRKNLTKTIVLLGNKLKEEITKKKQPTGFWGDEKLTNLVKERNAEAIYNIMKRGGEDYETEDLINAIIATQDADGILCAAVLCTKINITQKQFLKCAQAIVDLRAANESISFSEHCYGNQGYYNSFNVLQDFLKMIKDTQDIVFMNEIIEIINKKHAAQLGEYSAYIPLSEVVSTEMLKFREYVNKIRYEVKKSEV